MNINFDQSGIASACCFNRTHVLGRYPSNSLSEMWYGESAQKLRKYIREEDFSHGCELCEKQIDAGNYYGVRARFFDKYSTASASLLRSFFNRKDKIEMPQCLEFELSNTCNLECTMCDGHFSSLIRKNREGLPPLDSPYDEGFVEQLIPFLPHLRDAKFLGGEPFLVPIYFSIWEKIAVHNPKIKVHITTNGTVWNNKVERVLDKLWCGVIVSIDSLERETYESIRINSKFERVMANIEKFRAYTKRIGSWMCLAICPMTNNWREIPAFVNYGTKTGTFLGFNTVFKPAHLSLKFKTRQELEEIVDYLESQSFTGSGDVYDYNMNVYKSLVDEVRCWKNESKN